MRLWRSFQYVLRGLGHAARRERNFQLHLAALAVVAGLGLVTRLSLLEWALISLAAGAVLSAEAMNTALERLADALHPKRHPGVGLAKDLAAGAVLLSAMAALLIGLLVFLPHWMAP
jgi:diacylglycerol kinase